ncbi:MAG: hypothetical protein AAFP22_21045, partial [Planctomycetota bacterium]
GALNEDEDGVPCAACAERLLETLPGVFHTPWAGARDGGSDARTEARIETQGGDAPFAAPPERGPGPRPGGPVD